jgi:hypothetical protein
MPKARIVSFFGEIMTKDENLDFVVNLRQTSYRALANAWTRLTGTEPRLA